MGYASPYAGWQEGVRGSRSNTCLSLEPGRQVSTASADLYYCGAGTPLEEARAVLAQLEHRHASGEHFWRWTGRILAGRQVFRCMFCLRHRSGAHLPEAP